MQQLWLIEERHEGRGVWVYLLGALPVDHGWGWWWGQNWEFRAEKLAGLQRWGVVCHVSLIHTTEEVLLQQKALRSIQMYKVYHKALWCHRVESSSQSLDLCWELHLPRMSTGCGFSFHSLSIQSMSTSSPKCVQSKDVTYVCMLKVWLTIFTLKTIEV